MVEVETVPVDFLTWAKGASGRFWFVQPHLQLAGGMPLVPIRDGETAGLRLLRATLNAEREFVAPEAAPAFILLPEFSIHPDEVHTALELSQASRPNTVVVFGVGQMTEDQARRLEPRADLWQGPSEERVTNCAVVSFGGSMEFFLQPKIVRSRWEQDTHWPGRVVRYFQGRHVQFVVVICSELLNRPDGATTAAAIVDKLDEQGRALNLVVWIQHNPKPRSEEFVESIEQFRQFRTTIAVVGSRPERSVDRLNNYAVSGAILPQDALSSKFDLLTKRFHYVEPLANRRPLSRAVLLRYDADAYRVQTVLAAWLAATDGTAKGALLEESQPYRLDGTRLQISSEMFHIDDIAHRGTERARAALPSLAARIGRMKDAICQLGTREFLEFLDMGILPRPMDARELHPAGVEHPHGDFRCVCWKHRECVDNVSDEDECAEPLAQLLLALAALDASGVEVIPSCSQAERTNVLARIDGVTKRIGVVYPFDYNAEGTEQGLWGRRGISMVDSGYIILGTGERSIRPRIGSVDAAVARPLGATQAGVAAAPVIRGLYSGVFWPAYHAGTLRTVVRDALFE